MCGVSYLQVLHFLYQLDVFLRKTSFVGGDVNNGAVQFLDFNVQFADRNFQFFSVFHRNNTFLVQGFNLRKELVNFSLEFTFFFVSSAEFKKQYNEVLCC